MPRTAAQLTDFAETDSGEYLKLTEASLRIFDRAFLVTYALEAVAVVIGLLGVAFAASSAALARRGEFAMLRHLGMPFRADGYTAEERAARRRRKERSRSRSKAKKR